ncbi:MAG: pantetheine-phosphate adenylyltransferase [Planctomycetota bacterium]
MTTPQNEPRRAVFPGTFDPVTRGHIDLVERAAHVFDELTVVVAAHHDKRHLLSVDERVELLSQAMERFPHARAVAFDGLVVDAARQFGATAIVRGVRNTSDLEYERQLALANRSMNPEVETVLLFPSAEYAHVSSTLVRQIARFGGDLSSFVAEDVAAALRKAVERSE